MMLPILYDKTGNTQIGILNDTIECFVTEERNGNFELNMIYPSTSEILNDLINGNIIVADASDNLKNQKFRIYNTRKMMSNRIEICARHISFDLANDYIESLSIEEQSCEYALNMIFRSSQFSQHYRGYSDIVMVQDFKHSKQNCLNAIVGVEGSIIDTFGNGAEILRDNTNIYVYNDRGSDNGVTIEYRKNLTGLTLEEYTDDLVTRIRPYAKYKNSEDEEIEMLGDFVDSPYINNYSHPYIAYVDYSDKFDDENLPTTDALTQLAQKEYTVNKVDIIKSNYKIEFIPLSKCVGYEGLEDKIDLCDIVYIKDTRYNIDTQAKVIKVVFNVLKGRYDSMELGDPKTKLGDVITTGALKGEKGDKGEKGEAGKDGSIGDFPDTLPETPVISYKLYGFASIELTWTFENEVFYSYELYASKIEGFVPNTFNLIFAGQASAFLHQVDPEETWYYRVCGINTYGNRTTFSEQVTVSTAKIGDLSNYVEEMAISDALIGTLSLDRGWVGQLHGNWIDARQLSVTDGNGVRTLDIDSFGNVNLNVASLEIKSDSVVTNDSLNSTLGSYPTITEMNSAITQKADEINLSVTQTINNIQTGGKNLIKNGNFEDGLNHWVYERFSGVTTTDLFVRENDEWCMDGKKQCSFNTHSINDDSQRKGEWTVRQYFKTVVGQEYTISYMIAGHRSYKTVAVRENKNWGYLGSKDYGHIEGGKNANNWVYDSITFTATTSDTMIWFIMRETTSGTNGHMWFTDVCCVEGNKAQRFIPSLEEYSTTAQMNSAIQLKADSITSTVNANYTTLNNKFNDYPTTTQMNSAINQKADSITSNVNMTKIAGVELLPQGYRRNSTSGYHVRYNGTLNVSEYGLYVSTAHTWVETDFIAIDAGLPLEYFFYMHNTGGHNPLTYIGFEQYNWKKEEIGENAGTIYVVQEKFAGYKTFRGTIPENSFTGNTRYIKLRWLTNWDSSTMAETYIHDCSVKQLGYINSSTQIAQMSDSITSTVSSVTSLGSRMSTAESTITQHTNQIATKVDVNGVKSTIQQNPESVRIGFNGISDYFDLNSTRLQVGHSDGSYTQIGQNGVTYYASGSGHRYHNLMKQGWLGQISGTSWSRTITLPSEFKGKVFSIIISVTEVNAVNTHDVIKHFKITVPQDTVNYTNGTFVINASVLAYYVPGQQSATAIQMDVSWIAIA